MSAVVRSIDVGYGNTKYIHSVSPAGEIRCRVFPTIAPPRCLRDLTPTRAASINFPGIYDEIGSDAGLERGNHFAQPTHKDMTETAEHLALVRTALSVMSIEHVDLLVVGFPVSLPGSRRGPLERMLRGTHSLLDGRTVDVDRVIALDQPLGGLIDHALRRGRYEEFRKSINLVVDLGFLTVDWVLAQGIRPVEQRSGSFAGGMHAILRCIAHTIGARHGVELDDWGHLDEALRTGGFRLLGKPLSLSPYLAIAGPVVHDTVQALASSVGQGAEIDNIVLVGGAAPLFQSAIERRFPWHRVQAVHESVFANVRGFQRVGMELVRRREARSA
jgi:plasmid segregation protein ParM